MKKITLLVFLLITVLKVEAQTSTFAVSDSLFAIGRYKMALAAIDNQPKSFESHLKKATIYESIDDYRKAIHHYKNALTLKDDYTTKLKLAKNYRALKQYENAIAIYEEITEKDSLNLVLQYQLGKLYIITKQSDNAEKTFTNLIEKDDENANYDYHLGLAFGLQKKGDEMMKKFFDTYKKDTLHLRAISRLAKILYKIDDPITFKMYVDRGLAISPNDNDLNRLKINFLYKIEKYDKAIPYLLRLDSLPQDDTYTKSMLGRTYYKLDSLDLAENYFEQLARLDPEDYKARTYLGHIHLEREEYRDAMMDYFISTSAGQEKRDEEYYGLATVFWKTDKIPMAIDFFEKAFEENRRNHRALYQQAKLSDDYYKDKKIAYKLYQKYIEAFWRNDEVMANFVRKRIKEIKNDYFQKGEILK